MYLSTENQRIAVNDTQYVINSQPNLSQVLVRTKGNGEVTYYVYGLGLIGEESAGNYFSYHFDYRGSTIAITNITGQLLDIVQYSPFGVVLSQPIFDTPFLFNGLYGVMTDGNRLNYMRARYYSAEIRRFVNQDILLGNVADGQSLNRFAFVMGNPVSFVDPFGLEGYNITDEQRELADSGDFLAFWESRWNCKDPVARTALNGWGKPELVDASWFEQLSAGYTWTALSNYISYHNLPVTMEEIGRALAKAHADAVKTDAYNIPHLLSPRQVATYHHDVFKNYGIPPYLFGGTLPAGVYLPIFGGITLYEVNVPVPGGWEPAMLDANSYSNMWCGGCDTLP
jgi:RHS repeat-associated protein